MPAFKKSFSSRTLSPLTLGLLIAGFIVVIGFISALLIPQYLKIRKLDDLCLKKQIALSIQEELYPVFAQAQKLSQVDFQPTLPFPEKSRLDRNQITSLTDIFKSLAEEHDLTLAGNSLDISMLNRNSDHMIIELSLNGELSNFRGYLISLAELNFFGQIQRLRILADIEGKKQMVATLKINVEKN